MESRSGDSEGHRAVRHPEEFSFVAIRTMAWKIPSPPQSYEGTPRTKQFPMKPRPGGMVRCPGATIANPDNIVMVMCRSGGRARRRQFPCQGRIEEGLQHH